MSQKYLLLTLVIGLLTSLVGCTQSITGEQAIVSTDIPIPTERAIIATATAIQFPRPPIPTISSSNEADLVEVLNSTDCKLPCYMEITPGKTKLEDAILLLNSIGAVYLGQSTNDSTTRTSYDIQFDDPLIELDASHNKEQKVLNSLGLVSVDGVVQQVNIWLLSSGLSPKFQDYWSRYTPRGVFLQIGMPDEIYSVSGLLVLIYKDLGIINMYSTFWKDGQLCPQYETGYFDRRFEITNPDSQVEIFSEHQESLKFVWEPIEESLGVSVQEFYRQVVADDTVCFDIKIK